MPKTNAIQEAVIEKIPHNLEAEKSTLAAVIMSPEDAAPIVFSLLESHDFFSESHRVVFRHLNRLHEAKRSIDMVTLADSLTTAGDWEKAGGAYTAEIIDGFPKISNVDHHCKIVKEKSALRNLVHVCSDVINTITAGGMDETADEILDKASESVTALILQAGGLDRDPVTHKMAAENLVASIKSDERPMCIRTGLGAIDDTVGGFRAGELVVYTAETGVGKTLLAQQTRRQACRDGHHGLFASAEMAAEHLVARELAAESGVPPGRMRKWEWLKDDDKTSLARCAPFECDQCKIIEGDLSLRKIRYASLILNAELKGKIGFVIMDYDELIDAPGGDEFKKQVSLVKGAKRLGQELKCPVILISQMRKLLQGEDLRKPTLNRLYGAGAKSKHPHCVVYVDRKFQRDLKGDETEARVCILKNRDGQVGSGDAYFSISKLRFFDKAEEDQELGEVEVQEPPDDG
jgi:replicative DNA helicase